MAETSGTNRWKKTKDTLGQGGQGQIFVVVDGQGQLAGQYAFKQLLNPKRESRLKNEILTTKNLFALGAPVLRIVDDYLSSEPDAKNPWYVTPIVPAGNLRYWIKRQFPLGPSEDWTLEFFKRYAEGLRQIHRSGVAHRDLKPENILMDQDGHPIFCDLGLCLPIDEDMGINITTQDLERIGSLHYTPREGYGGSRVKGEAQFAFDIFASGKILYELLSGRVLPGLENHRSPDYDLIRLKGNDFSRAVNLLLDGLLHDDPTARLRTWNRLDDEINSLRMILHPSINVGTKADQIRAMLLKVDRRFPPPAQPQAAESTSSQSSQARCKSLIEEVSRIWSEHEEVKTIQSWLSTRTDIGVSERRVEASIFASLLEGPYIYTKRGLEPLRSVGWKRSATVRQESLIGFRSATERQLMSLWMGASVFATTDRLMCLLMLIQKESSIQGQIDVRGQVKQVEGDFYLASLEQTVRDVSLSVANEWVKAVLQLLEGLR